MSESNIITDCIECENGDIVKTINNTEPDQYHCNSCMQEYFESVNYSSPSDVFKVKKLKQQLKQRDGLIKEMYNLLINSSWAFCDEEVREIDCDITRFILRPEIQEIINKEKK